MVDCNESGHDQEGLSCDVFQERQSSGTCETAIAS